MNTQIKSALISLRKARIDRGYSQVEAAEIMGLPDTIQLSRWEHGMRLPSLINALKLSAAYNSSVDSLLYGISASLTVFWLKRPDTVGQLSSEPLVLLNGLDLSRKANPPAIIVATAC